MTNCESNASDVSSYSLKTLCRATTPQDFEHLEQWLSWNGRQSSWDGKIYVASTIYWDVDGHEFLQRGCSPNYQAGWWSLACCKHDMRTARPFRDEAIDLSIPTYVFTLARLDPRMGQPLVSVAQITEHCFDTMEQYAEFLLKTDDRAFISSRLTRVRRNDGLLGSRFGDCHADMAGEVGEPDPQHVHHDVGKSWKADIDGRHLILVSNRFLLWREPVFVAARTQKQSRYGKNITSDTLEDLLKISLKP
jgi:hypothetical protein